MNHKDKTLPLFPNIKSIYHVISVRSIPFRPIQTQTLNTIPLHVFEKWLPTLGKHRLQFKHLKTWPFPYKIRENVFTMGLARKLENYLSG
jgi:hypothetical protein